MKKEFKRESLYCVDCKKWTWQHYHGEMPDNTLLYQCTECGCENSFPKEG